MPWGGEISRVPVGRHASVQAGAGIVHDSVPKNEAAETMHKARGLLSVAEGFR